VTCPTPASRQYVHYVEWLLVGGRHNGTRVEVPATTTHIFIEECQYVRDDRRGRRQLFHVDHEGEK